jgi:hypothetical protein
MPYKISAESVEVLREVLDQIYNNAKENKTTVIVTKFPKQTAWYIRQAFKSAEVLSIEPYNQLSVRAKAFYDPASVVVYPKFIPKDLELTILSAPTGSVKTLHGVSGMRGVIEAALNPKIKETILSFPDLEPSLLQTALSWARTIGHEITSEQPFTFRRKPREAKT